MAKYVHLFNYKKNQMFSDYNNIFNNYGYSEDENSSNNANPFKELIFSDNELDDDVNDVVNDDVSQIGDQANIPDQNNDNGSHNEDHQVQDQEPNPSSSITQFTTKKRGRKKKDSNEKGDHDKYAEDHIFSVIKTNIIFYLMTFINNIFSSNGFKDKILQIKGERAKNNTTLYNRDLLKMNLKDFFSVPISKKNGKHYEEDHNTKVLDKIYNMHNPVVNNVLDRTFLESIKHFRGSEWFVPLSGFEKYYHTTLKKLEKDEKYVALFKDKLSKYETIFYERQARARRI